MKFTLPSFNDKSVPEILDIVSQVPAFIDGNVVDELDFSKTELFKLNWDKSTAEEFMLPVNGIIEIINAIPEHILHLNLSDCNVAYANTGRFNNGRINFEQAELLYSAMGNLRFKEITFWRDSLGDMPNLAQLIGKLQQERVNLSCCFLWKAPSSRLECAAQAVSEKVTHLNISYNGLHSYTTMKGFVSALASKKLQEINVEDNELDNPKINTPAEIASIFSVLSEHCFIKGIDLKAIRERVAATDAEISVATLKQEIENLASRTTSIIIKSDLREDASLTDCIKALVKLFQVTRSGMSSNFTLFGSDQYMQMKCAMSVAEIVNIQEQLESVSNATTSEEVSEFLTEFSNIKTINVNQKIAEYTEKLQEIVNALPVARQSLGVNITSRMLTISRQVLDELSIVYDKISQRHEAGDYFINMESP